MINHKRANNKGNNKIEKVVKMKLTSNDQKDHQEVQPSRDEELNKRRKELQDELQGFMYQQSSKFSSVSRTLVLGIIGTIWVITYTDKKLSIPNIWLLGSILSGILFLLIDVNHYYWDSMSYHKEAYRLDEYKSLDEFNKNHEQKMDAINKRSHRFIVVKFWILMLAAVLFIIGIIKKTLFLDYYIFAN